MPLAIPLLKGIRDNIQNHPPGFATQNAFVQGVKEIARRGLHFELCLKHWQLGETLELVRYARQAADAFGPTRIMFGSDWPVKDGAGGFAKWYRVAEALAASWSTADQESFFYRNAARVYRLSGAP